MSLNLTPTANRVHIGFFGRRNVGKSSLLNAVTGQDLAVVSDVLGTTTDPVQKAMELLPLGPVVIIDTPGLDDVGGLGEKRVKKARQVLNRVDVAVLVVEAGPGLTPVDEELLGLISSKNIPHLVAYNKSDLLSFIPESTPRAMYVSATTGQGVKEIKELLATLAASEESKLKIVGDILHPTEVAVLVVPIDKAAPKGRLILPQQQTIRDILEADAAAVVVKERELKDVLERLAAPPALVITDSQVLSRVSADTPPNVPLTTFSILFARYKGYLTGAAVGAATVDRLPVGANILMAEGCTHHRQCDDIGTVKLPRWIRNYAGRDFNFSFMAGGDFPEDLSSYGLIVHCGACMLNDREVHYRRKCAEDQGVPLTNYGTIIAHMQGLLRRCLGIFPHILALMESDS
ncbi:MAG: [FeFe] hydrogenase H-cluster maturation GTPase HydF [Deltaproteobacteria bacterium]|jgi:[FeFe] hydrogenase H-cluster maturation GTPase HydF|nr:[FeFe] hydrogenase H-cluster maturation GTPase HydF [Deltaproteobacteria bacterium]